MLAAERDGGLRSDLPIEVLKIGLVAAAYYVAARLGLRFALIERNVTPLWPPTGIALVAFLLMGRRIWPGIALAAFLVNAPISTSVLPPADTAAGNTLAPFVAAELLRWVRFRTQIDRLRDAIAIVLAALLGMIISASIGAGTLVLSGALGARSLLAAWAVWWTGDAMGVLVVAPFLLSLRHLREHRRLTAAERVEAGVLFVLLTALSLVVMHSRLQVMFLVLPLLGWAAWRFQQRGAAPAALLVAGVATWAADHGLGPFSRGGLFGRMLTLQAFNATAAFGSFVLAAVVTERMRAKEALERAAMELEERVRDRTSELSASNEHLTREIGERKHAERRLRQRERQLAEAQQVARIGSWEWVIPEDRVEWSDEMYRIYGHPPGAFDVNFEKAIAPVVPEDLVRIQQNLARAMGRRRSHDLPPSEYRIRRPDGSERVLVGNSKLTVSPDGEPLRLVGTVRDITEEKEAEREHRIAETLQRSLLPEHLPEIPGFELASRYVAATAETKVGGDWYDVVSLPNGNLGVAIGDVAGHGLRAASTMGQLRMALRAYALEGHSPAELLGRLHLVVQKLLSTELATLVYAVLDAESDTVTFANAGHPPPLEITDDGLASYHEEALGLPLGAAPYADSYVEATFPLVGGSTLLLFTDGLVERRGVSLDHGLERLKHEASGSGSNVDTLCDRILKAFQGTEFADDVALLAIRPVVFVGQPLHVRVPAEPFVLAPIRQALRRWLRAADASSQDSYDVTVACGEACANAIQHAYGSKDGTVEVELSLADGQVEVSVRDSGTWRPPSSGEGGRGIALMQALMDSVDVERGPDGTRVRMRRRLRAGADR
jgi:PAS domain S-box-containing protein